MDFARPKWYSYEPDDVHLRACFHPWIKSLVDKTVETGLTSGIASDICQQMS